MAVDQEVTVPGVLILAYPGFDHGRLRQRGYVLLQVGLQMLERICTDQPCLMIRITLRPVTVEGNLEASAVDVGQRIWPIRMRVMKPGWHLSHVEGSAARWRTEKEDVLSRREDSFREHVGKELG